jgi:hypothetical protein
MFKPFVLLSAIGLATAAMAAGKPPVSAIPSYDTFSRTIRSYPYKAPAAREAQIQKGASTLARCMSKAQVLKQLGSPDFERDLRDPQEPRKSGIASSWTYYLVRKSAQGEESDAQVILWFNTQDKLEAMFLRGVPRPVGGGKGAHLRKCG